MHVQRVSTTDTRPTEEWLQEHAGTFVRERDARAAEHARCADIHLRLLQNRPRRVARRKAKVREILALIQQRQAEAFAVLTGTASAPTARPNRVYLRGADGVERLRVAS